jgi:hypothetical protein
MPQGLVMEQKTVRPVSVILHPWQVEWAAHAGQERTDRNIGHVKNKPDYEENPDALQTDIEANTASCLCELATSLYANQRWNGPYWHPKHHPVAKGLPDIGRNIEVRRTRNIGAGIPVFEHEAERKIVLVQAYVSPDDLRQTLAWAQTGSDAFEHVNVLLVGTVCAAVAWEKGWQKYPEKKVCPASMFCSVEALRDTTLCSLETA